MSLKDEIGLMARAGTSCVVFDLSSLEFIDSSGLSLLVTVASDVGRPVFGPLPDRPPARGPYLGWARFCLRKRKCLPTRHN